MTARANLKTYLAISVVLLGVGWATATERIFVDADVTGPEIRQDYVSDEIIVKFKNNAAITLEEKILTGSGVAQLELSGSLDKLNKKFRLRNVKPVFKNFKAHRRRLNALLKKDKALLTKREKRILQRLKRSGEKTAVPALDRIYKLQLDLKPNQSIQQVLAAYNRDPSVEYAELNYIVSICKTPDDPLYSLQWPLENTGQMYPESGSYNHPPGTPDCDIDAPEAWDIHTGSSKVVVAVVDSGVDYRHRDLQGNIWVNSSEIPDNGIDDDDNGYIDDIYGYDFINNDSDPIDDLGHGTHCSGIIAARGNNGLDVAGVCWNAKIMALKFLNAAGQGYTSDAVTAFYYAVENGADVISSSWGGGNYSETLKEAIDYAHSQGVIMVAAAGNGYSDTPHYPACYEHMIAVAATNSNDAKPSFSNYGDWVDIAAPGVDILSLRASGTSGGTPYDSYTTIATGTSMACPHVAGACALLLSFNATLTSGEVNDILMETGDPISPGICLSDGRLNLLNAMIAAVPSRGYISLEHDVYSCSSVVSILLLDCDIKGQGSQQVTLTAGGGDTETVLLTEGAPAIGVFTGTIPTASGAPNIQDGTLQLLHGEIITVTYQDEDDGTGNPATDTALADCESPEIFNVQIDVPGPEPTVTFETDEPSMTRVRCGLACGGPYIIERSYPILATSHTMKLIGVSPKTDYFFIIEATDTAGNETVDDNAGACFAFTTDDGPGDIYVPGQYSTIQEAIYRSWNGGTVRVADGTYTGEGNRDLDFVGKAITVRSENGPENCIIDCNGTESESHRGFYFHSGEDANSVLAGFTITNGYVSGSWYVGIGGGILCDNHSSPTITNCIIIGNSAGWDGGGMFNESSNPMITSCTFSRNSAVGNDGGAINNEESSSPTITNCTFNGNSAYDWGGAIRNVFSCNPTITNCTFSGNSADDGGAMFYYHECRPTITNCTFAGNSARNGNALACDSRYQLSASNLRLSNCILRNGGDEIWNNDGSTITITYSDVQSGWPGTGNINADPLFVGLGVGDLRLLPASPCIDAGDNTAVPPDTPDLDGDGDTTEPIPFDLAGHQRFVDQADVPDTGNGTTPIVDMGAYEANYIEVAMKFTPQALNPGSHGNWVKAHFVLPEGFDVDDVDANTPAILQPGDVESEVPMNVFVNEANFVEVEAAFERGSFCEAGISDEAMEVRVVGSFTSGQYFYGTDTIRIIADNLKYLAVFASHWLDGGCGAPDWCGGVDLDHNSMVDFVDFALFDGCCIEVIRQ